MKYLLIMIVFMLTQTQGFTMNVFTECNGDNMDLGNNEQANQLTACMMDALDDIEKNMGEKIVTKHSSKYHCLECVHRGLCYSCSVDNSDDVIASAPGEAVDGI